ncbi:hypothetical protein [Pseudarthrobacter oxydans]|nr:hypothetical protein GCM10017547_31890 [Pseudarthrobacter oxydans]
MQQRTEVIELITFADDKTPVVETATDFEDRWFSNCLLFPERDVPA